MKLKSLPASNGLYTLGLGEYVCTIKGGFYSLLLVQDVIYICFYHILDQ